MRNLSGLVFILFILPGCVLAVSAGPDDLAEHKLSAEHMPDYYLLRPAVEKSFGYSHAVRVGDIIKISGAVSMDQDGNPTANDDMQQQIVNAYSDLAKILRHYDCTFDDVIVENIFTTDMQKLLAASAYRNSIYSGNFPTGTWLEVKGLAFPEFMVEIELEAYKPR